MLEITEEQLAEWTALCKEMSDWPWTWERLIDGYVPAGSHLGETMVSLTETSEGSQQVVNYIEEAVNAMPDLIAALREARERHERLLGGFGDLQELLNALAVEQAKVKRLRETLEKVGGYPDLFCPDMGLQRPHTYSDAWEEFYALAARVLKETEDGT